MVINYDVPHDVEDYVHRIGRTARADRDGMAITFVNQQDVRYFNQIEAFLEKEIEKATLPPELGEAPEYKPVTKLRQKDGRHGRKDRGNGSKGKSRYHRRRKPAAKKNKSNDSPKDKPATNDSHKKRQANNGKQNKVKPTDIS